MDREHPYAAHIKKMIDNEEFDALRTLFFTDAEYDPTHLFECLHELVFTGRSARLREFFTESVERESEYLLEFLVLEGDDGELAETDI